MELNGNTRVGDIVKENFRTAQLFDKNKIDFCCGGSISIEEACSKADIDTKGLISELKIILSSNDADTAYINALNADELCDYIEKRHHSYVREHMPFLLQKLEKLCQVHGDNHTELHTIKELFEGATKDLSNHLIKEEQELFPYIRLLAKKTLPQHKIGFISTTIDTLDSEHQTEGDRFAEIARLSNNYTCPPDACNTYRITIQTLKEFEQDLHRHVHLENNILFLKALELEKELTNY
ncbi:iron-sulfur cluster repair di-iron protein [Carboxylicivirga taeanensis]|uniref:iron-sulfur cluster repair di-iron protein n=1 Tax=Carboxylicivirga taeanensis TaxID=1416875 RepID=UPI003F6DD028